MANNSAEKWAKQVADAEEHADRVYNEQLKHLERQINAADKEEAHVLKVVERQVALDVKFAENHVKHLAHVIEYQTKKVDNAYDHVAKLEEEGKNTTRALARAEKIEADADEHIAIVAKHVAEAIERDAEAAGDHVAHGVEKIEKIEEKLGKRAEGDAERVAKADENVVNKAAQ